MADKYKLYLWINDTYSVLNFNVSNSKTFNLSTDYKAPYYVPELDHNIKLIINNDQDISFNQKSIALGQVTLITQYLKILILKEKVKTISFDITKIKHSETLSIGNDPANDIYLECNNEILLKFDRKNYNLKVLVAKKSDTYINHQITNSSEYLTLSAGDIFFISNIELIFQDNDILIMHDLQNNFKSSRLFYQLNSYSVYPDDYPEYHRSPRVIMSPPKERITIDTPPSKEERPKNKLAKTIATPLIMVGASILMSLINRNMTTMIMMGAMSITTVTFSISSYFSDKKEQKQKAIDRINNYHDYLQTKIIEIQTQKQKTREALEYHFPTVQKLVQLVLSNSPRIYEKNKFQSDFLAVRIGTGNVDAPFKVDFTPQELEKDDLITEARQIYKASDVVENSPISISLMTGGVGLVGNLEQVGIAIKNILFQLAVFQSYLDVRFIAIFNENNYQDWEPFKWLKHFRFVDSNILNFIYNAKTRDQLLTSLFQILKDREQTLKEKGNKSDQVVFSPYYVLIVQNEELIINHSIMEYLAKDISNLGVAVIFIKNTIADLPEHIKNVIEYKDSKQGEIIIENGLLSSKKFIPDNIKNINLELAIRRLSSLDHKESLKNSIPTSISLLDLYGTNDVNDLEIENRWNTNLPYKSLAVPLGARGTNDIVKLDLHERAHGPHGLIAGTTGSGKSELIQSYIASLAINFHPDNVGFLLIDYKGGGMANLFSNLPHLLGTITNLDGSQSLRALASIKAELEKRQTLFGKYNVNHINEYQKLYHDGVAKEAMPHLFLISDEFAELKSEQPDFMQELVSTARIGRSLGIHLILATQKPSGVVNEQIWSNSRFKIALKVQDKADSNEILHTPDAASIVEPGRAYLQVGNNEIYELFQSAYSGKNYNPGENETEEYTPIYVIDEMGQYKNFSEDLSGLADKNIADDNKSISELTAIIDYISEFARSHKIERLPRPWLPPLADKIFYEDYGTTDYQTNWKQASSLTTYIGMVDYPDHQAQNPFALNITEYKHIAVFGSPGYGKSTFIQTFIMGLCRQNSPETFNVYLLDFGTNGLIPLRDLPHVADLIRIDETEKIMKFQDIIEKEVDKRKKVLSKVGVANLDQYIKATGKQMPIIEIAIDTVDSAKEVTWNESFTNVLDKITREGANVGVYLLITANRHAALRMQLLSNIKTQISLFLFDKSEVTDIVGRTQLVIDDQAGRGIVKLDEPRLFQTFLPAKGEDSLEILENIKKEAQQMQSNWNGIKPQPIPMIPEELTWDIYMEMSSCSSRNVPLGLDTDTTLPVTFDLDRDKYFIIMNDTDEQKDLFDQLIRNELQVFKDIATFIFEIDSDQAVQKLQEFSHRSGDNKDLLVYVPDLEELLKLANDNDIDFKVLLENSSDKGLYFIFNTYLSFLSGNYDEVPSMIRGNLKVGIIGSRLTDQDLINFKYISNEKYLKEDEGYYFRNRSYSKIRIPNNQESDLY